MDSYSKRSKKHLCQIYVDLQNKLKTSNVPSSSPDRKREIMDLLHEFNDVKDAAQTVIGALANVECKTIKELHIQYNLPLNE